MFVRCLALYGEKKADDGRGPAGGAERRGAGRVQRPVRRAGGGGPAAAAVGSLPAGVRGAGPGGRLPRSAGRAARLRPGPRAFGAGDAATAGTDRRREGEGRRSSHAVRRPGDLPAVTEIGSETRGRGWTKPCDASSRGGCGR